MSSAMITDRVSELTVARTPFVRATVVRVQAPSSVRAGDDAIVLSDGTIEGFVGGQCTQNTVRTAAIAALRGSTVTLLRVLPDDSDPFPATPGAQVVVNPCQSGGAVEIFLEPVLPPPLLVVTGATPIAQALRSMARVLGYTVVDPQPTDGRDGAAPAAPADALAGCSAVLLASHGPGEPEVIRAALDADIAYIGLVASRKRSAAVFDEMGLTDEERARIDAPAGQWIGARTAPEIALSILASVVAAVRLGAAPPVTAPTGERRDAHGGGADPSAPASPTPPVAQMEPVPRHAEDPVCHMTVTVVPETPHARIGGVDHYFCRSACRESFLANQRDGRDAVAP